MDLKIGKRNFDVFNTDDNFSPFNKKQAYDPMEIDDEEQMNGTPFNPNFNPLYKTFGNNCQTPTLVNLPPYNFSSIFFPPTPTPTVQVPVPVPVPPNCQFNPNQFPFQPSFQSSPITTFQPTLNSHPFNQAAKHNSCQQLDTHYSDKRKGLFNNRANRYQDFELVIDLANFIGNDYHKVKNGFKLSADKFDDLLYKLSRHTNIQIVSIVFCTKHDKGGNVTDKYYDCVKRWVVDLENTWCFKELGISVTVNVCEYEGINKKVFIKGKDLENESDDTGIIVTQLVNNIGLQRLNVTDDKCRSMRKNVEILKDLNASIVIRTCDPYKEFVSRNSGKMDFETFSIKASDLVLPSIIKVFNYRTNKFLYLFPQDPKKVSEVTCSHAVTSKNDQLTYCSCFPNNKRRTVNKSRSNSRQQRS